jgi:predicted CXXCH cytochrome family protein
MNNHHNTGFLAQGKCNWCHDFTGCTDCSGGACGFCHSSAQGAEGERGQITGEGGQFEKLSHHVGPDVIAEDCMVCHDLTYHLDGDIGTIPDPQVYLRDVDGGPSIIYDGTPESLETFCINCHDGDGADGNLIPFSDGMTVPNVKGVAGSMWADSAHAQIGYSENGNNPITCFGDGMTTGCHTSVHGSDYEKLLPESPIDQFCYNCHTEGLLENNSISLWDIPYCWGTNCEDRGSHTGNDNQAILTDQTAGKPGWAVGSLVGNSIRNNKDGSTGEITANTTNTITATLSGGTDNDWDRNDTYSFLNKTADDIEEAFTLPSGDKHDLGSSFTVGSTSYTLQCTTCHNPHVVTGRHWDVDQPGYSPITRPDLSANPSTNPRAMGTLLWGAASGEKMDDYAWSGITGTYRTPKGDIFAGSELPDYVTFCQDCHGIGKMPMPSDDPPGAGGIDWGANEAHGKMSANNPGGYGVCPNWYGCGKGENWDLDNCIAGDGGGSDADCWPVIPRARGDQIHTRAPYDHEERIGGANFTLSCTDCHEAHGSEWISMIRTDPNTGTGTIPGAGWSAPPNPNYALFANHICATCHYYYSDWHAGPLGCVASYGG